MSGYWSGQIGVAGTMTLEEHYTSTSNNLMLAPTRYLRDGRATQFDQSRYVTRTACLEAM